MTRQNESIIYHGLKPAVLDLDEADRKGQALDLDEIERARDILSGILDRHKEEIAA